MMLLFWQFFGSFVRGEKKDESDVDISIEFEKDEETAFRPSTFGN